MERLFGAGRRPFGWWRIPPQADEPDSADLLANLPDGGQQLGGHLSPSPPVMADVQNVIGLRWRSGRIDLKRGIVTEERERARLGVQRPLQGSLHDAVAERLDVVDPQHPLRLAAMVEIVTVNVDERI